MGFMGGVGLFSRLLAVWTHRCHDTLIQPSVIDCSMWVTLPLELSLSNEPPPLREGQKNGRANRLASHIRSNMGS